MPWLCGRAAMAVTVTTQYRGCTPSLTAAPFRRAAQYAELSSMTIHSRALLRVLPFSFATLLLTACQDTGQSPPSRPEPSPASEDDAGGSMLAAPIDLVYLCGNKFLVTNSTRTSLHVTYRVAGTKDQGEMTLVEGPGGDPGYSETELETVERGTVEVFQDDQEVARRGNGGIACGAPAMSASV